MKVFVASKNPVKIACTQEGFSKYFSDVEVVGVPVDSGVPDQPFNEDTFKGAENRALALKEKCEAEGIAGDFFVGIEGGLFEHYNRWFAIGIACVMDKNGKRGFGGSPHFQLPPKMMPTLLAGKELGVLMNEILEQENTQQKGGAIHFFTKGQIDRTQMYVPAVITALVPFLREEFFEDG